jgi:hypothetical protein
MHPRTHRQCLDKAKELIGLAVPEADDERREGLLQMADEWVAMGERSRRAFERPLPPARGWSGGPPRG